MADVIATIWDFDKTLINGYMQDPIFKAYGIDAKQFWNENNKRIEELRAQGLTVNADIYYLNQMISYVRNGKFKGLDNKRLTEYGKDQDFYPGVIELFEDICALNNQEQYHSEGIIFENYIISSGLKKVIEGTPLVTRKLVRNVWGCEFAESNGEISEVVYSIDNTTKTRAIFEINKGVNFYPDIDVNSAIPDSDRRVLFCNMIYTADGPSDIPAFSLINKNGGATFAVYPSGNMKAFQQVDKMRREKRVQMYAEANYKKGTTAYMWIMNKLNEQAKRIIGGKREAIQHVGRGTPSHNI